jgi:hypothetical protein
MTLAVEQLLALVVARAPRNLLEINVPMKSGLWSGICCELPPTDAPSVAIARTLLPNSL